MTGADVIGGADDLAQDVGFFDALDEIGGGQFRGVVHEDLLTRRREHLVHDAGRGADEVQAELALQPFLDDLHVQESQEPATETERQGRGRLGLERQGRVGQLQALEGFLQFFVILALHGIEPHRTPWAGRL
jgi:hypothetical protein